MRWLRGLAVGCLLGWPLGCTPTYAPPIRTPMLGAPGRVQHGDIELAAGAVGVVAEPSPPVYGGPTLAIGVSRRVTIEAGGDFAARDWAIGFAGVRVTGRVPATPRLQLVGDVELGAGGGVGGRRCKPNAAGACDRDDLQWHDRIAAGGYGGFGGALRWRVPAIFTRVRVQPTGAKNTPVTVWTAWQTGLELRFVDRVSLWTGVGLASYRNRWDRETGGIYELGLAIRLTRD